ncbi:MAG TPA: DUF4388 domain-containing protein [Anaeromyxobacteraceae bacterium]|nr:DUF4388 domain-containing protein [Anaeromyxobacteraceae bacterium]
MRGLTGSFSLMPLAELVDFLGRRRVTGSLTCERGTVRKTVQLREGNVVGAASTDAREFLGQLLINFGHLDEEQLAKAFRTQQETRVRLGKVLAMVGLVPPATVREVLGIKIRETLLDVFRWDSGVFSVDEEPPPLPDDELAVSVPLSDISKEAEFRATAWEAFRAQFPSGAASLVIDEDRIPASAREDTVDGKLLMLAVQGKTIDEIGLALHATEFHLYQRLYALARQGVLRAAPAPAGSPEAPAEMLAAAELVDRSRQHLAEGRAEEAEEAAARALSLAPGAEAAKQALADARSALSSSLRSVLDRHWVPVVKRSQAEIQALKLDSAEKYLLSRCDGRRDLGQISQVAPLDELQVLKAFRRFLLAGVVELRSG